MKSIFLKCLCGLANFLLAVLLRKYGLEDDKSQTLRDALNLKLF